MIEAIFGAEESKDQRLHTRFRKDENRERWGTIIAIGWDLKVLNRLRCTKELGEIDHKKLGDNLLSWASGVNLGTHLHQVQ